MLSTLSTTSKTTLQRPNVCATAFGYLLDPYLVNKEAIKDGTAIQEQPSCTFAAYRNRLIKECGVKYRDIVTVRNPHPNMSPIYCVAVATKMPKRPQHTRLDDKCVERVKEFLGTTKEPEWYYWVKD
jgi:hypothetical protein